MPSNRKPGRNGDPSNSDNIEEGMGRLQMESSGDDDNNHNGSGVVDDVAVAYPDRPGEPDCIYYLRTGTCGYGSNCRFNHPSNPGGGDGGGRQVNGVKKISVLPERAGQPDCGYYLKTGTCKYGSTCKYHHPKDRQADSVVLLNVLGLPMRQDEKPCPYYMRTGLCKYGYACKFHHPQPASASNASPVGPAYGSAGSAVVPSSVAPSVGELSAAASLPKPAYFPGSLLQFPQSYMPLVLSPSQSWNAYAGGVSQLPVTGVLAAPASNGSILNLPERPDQPECRYFMNHGSCKYGSDCKYHHPKEKFSQLASGSLGPFGLPIRPGQPICSYYSFYGLCKYGPTCRFDHPLDGYSYATFSLGIPPLASSYSPPPVVPYKQRMMPSSETSSQSSKLGDWIKKGGGSTGSNKNERSNTKTTTGGSSPDICDDSIPRSSSEEHSEESCSEVMQNESD